MSFFLEKYQTVNGKIITRIRSNVFYVLGIMLFILSIVLLLNAYVKAAVVLAVTIVPILLLYPLVRFLFGGKDSVASVIGTVVVEEALKHSIVRKLDKVHKKRK